MSVLKRYFFSGLLFWLPILITVYALLFLVRMVNASVDLIFTVYHPEFLKEIQNIPGFEILLALALVFISGVFVTHFLGRWFLNLGERLVQKIPLVRTIYSSAKQVLETVLSSSKSSFRRVVLVQYPSQGIFSVGFQTGSLISEQGELMLMVFVPSAPTPTSGFLIFVSEHQVTELPISIDEALKMVLSLGMVSPKIKF